jgi:hypothetical protein
MTVTAFRPGGVVTYLSCVVVHHSPTNVSVLTISRDTPRIAAPDQAALRGASYLAAATVFCAMLSLSVRAQDPQAAAGISLITLGALLAAPQLLESLIRSGRALALVRHLGRTCLLLSPLPLLIALLMHAHGDFARALGSVTGLAVAGAIWCAVVQLSVAMLGRSVAPTELAGAATWLDEEERIWMVVALAFCSGTALQFGATV